MRKFLTIILITAVIAGGTYIGSLAYDELWGWYDAGYDDGIRAAESGYYPETCIIVELDYAEDTVTVEDVAGNLWQFYGTEDFCIGDLVRMLMYNNGTPHSIYDDQIVLAWYAGTLQQFAEILDK